MKLDWQLKHIGMLQLSQDDTLLGHFAVCVGIGGDMAVQDVVSAIVGRHVRRHIEVNTLLKSMLNEQKRGA